MSYVNHYTPDTKPTVPESELYGPTPYDINFAYPIYEETLENKRTKLIPFIPTVHAEAYWKQVGQRPEIFRYYPYIFATLREFLTWFELTIRRQSHGILFAAIDKTCPDPEHPEWGGSFAGVTGLFKTVPHNLATEVAFVVVFPEFQRTHVAKDMIGVLLRYLLQLRSASPPGLGFRRVQWTAHPRNAASIGLAERMGFKREGTMNWAWVLPDELAGEGRPGRIGDAFSGKAGRDSVILSLCWDDWEAGAKEKVEGIIS
ncbi:acyl-CoA N-acyltransferase [Trametes maxima]|nr:acyl-CoA N-acyltransferase [Trametes maxima]